MKPTGFHPVGAHLLADMDGVDARILTDTAAIEQLLLKSASAASAHVLFSHFHTFGPGQGITGVVLLAESHISIHTWPEFGFAAADIFMCGNAEPALALDIIRLALKPASCCVQSIPRGLAEPAIASASPPADPQSRIK